MHCYPVAVLIVRPVSAVVARRQIELHHYARTLPPYSVCCLGAFEGERLIGVVVFGIGANRNAASPYASWGVERHDLLELTRLALCPGGERVSATTKVLALALRALRRERPRTRLLVSYADPAHGHVGTVYAAGNWTYVGPSFRNYAHARGHQRHARPGYDPRRAQMPKFKYLYALDPRLRARVLRLARKRPRWRQAC